mmetsp:Transcript_3938/g.11668  ORF Transcript_3938/g.11668 Transcript_3938/m.11668 type:complete len:737 (+) Transcript_3938:1590-3800(+)
MHAGGPGVRNGRPERLDILLRRGGQHRLQRLLAHTPQLTRRLAGDVAAPGRLNGDGDLCLHLEPARAQALEHARGEEDARLAAAELLAGHAELLEQRQHAVLGRLARELRLGAETGNHEEVAAKLVKGHAVGESGAGDTQRVEHARRVELARDDGVLDQVGLLLVVGLEAAHEVQVALVERADEVRELRREGVGDALELGRLELLPVARRGRHVRRLGEELLEQLVVGELHQHDQVLRERVLVLLEEAGRLVGHLARVVRDGEGGAVEPLLREVGVPRVLALDLLQPRGVRAGREEALLGEQREDAGGWLVDELDEQLVVLIRDVAHVDALLLVLGQYRLEDGLRKHLLQLLVCEVDAQLLERVGREALEAENVDGADEVAHLVAAFFEGHVDHLDDVVEEPRVERLGQGVLDVAGVGHRVWLRDPVQARLHVLRADGLLELRRLAREEAGDGGDDGRVLHLGVVLALAGEAEVAEVEHRHDDPPARGLLVVQARDHGERLGQLLEVAREVGPLDIAGLFEVEQLEALDRVRALREPELGPLRRREPLGNGVEHVVVLLAGQLRRDARLFEEVRLHEGALHAPRRGELQRQELAEARRVVVPDRLGAAKALHDGVGLQDALMQVRARAAHLGEVLEEDLCGLRLARARLAGNDDGLAHRVLQHARVRRSSDRVDVGRQLHLRRQRRLVRLQRLVRVQRQLLVRIHGQQEAAAARVDVAGLVALLGVVQERLVCGAL